MSLLNKFVLVPKAQPGMLSSSSTPWPKECLARITDVWVNVSKETWLRVSRNENDHVLCKVEQVVLVDEKDQESALGIWELQGDAR